MNATTRAVFKLACCAGLVAAAIGSDAWSAPRGGGGSHGKSGPSNNTTGASNQPGSRVQTGPIVRDHTGGNAPFAGGAPKGNSRTGKKGAGGFSAVPPTHGPWSNSPNVRDHRVRYPGSGRSGGMSGR